MNTSLFQGQLVRLAGIDPETFSTHLARWFRNSEFFRLEASDVSFLYPKSAILKRMERNQEHNGEEFYGFAIHALADGRLLGDIGLEAARSWVHGEGFVGLGIGEPEYWGKGYGTEAMRLILRYGFTELNLHRISLSVFAYNPRAIRSYEKAGFRHEGRARQVLNRNGQRWDILYMGILRQEWQALQPD